mgnify:FL=1
MTLYIYNDLSASFASVEKPDGAINLSQVLQVLETAKDIDWGDIIKVLENKENDIAALTTLDDLLKVVSPFIPQASLAATALGLFIAFLKNTHPSQPYEIPGYHWDALNGWVPDTQGE